ncbi:MAG: acyltransferase [Lysobacteraceae bacterium]
MSIKPRYRSLQDAMGSGDNLLLLRMLAASLVIHAHSYALSPVKDGRDPVTNLFGIYAGSIAVYVFFFISGFLVTGSWQRRHDLRAFLIARLFRVVPAYALCLAGCALLIGPFVTQLDPATYFRDPLTWSYLFRNLTFTENLQFNLPGVFSGQSRESVNGSLWTLPAEMRAYTLLALLGILGILSDRLRTALCLGIAALLILHWHYPLPLVKVASAKPLIGYFALGVLTWTCRERLPFNLWIGGGLVAASTIARLSRDPSYPYLFALALCYLSLLFAYRLKSLGFYNRFGDYSYGIYLWGFPMQQLVVYWLQNPSPGTITLIAWPMALLCAVLSWRFVEKPAIALGRRSLGVPGSAQPAPRSPVAARDPA